MNPSQPKKSTHRPRVLVLHTGGTIGMDLVANRSRLTEAFPEALEARFRARAPELEQLAEIQVEALFNADSAHLGPADWKRLAGEIRKRQAQFDGFVVLHGTDTLAYAASALSILLRDLDRPVVLTGAMRPLYALRTDARRNLIASVEVLSLASNRGLSGVMVFFDDTLYAGQSVRKRSAIEFAAFASPKEPALAQVGTEIEFSRPVRRHPQKKLTFKSENFSERVSLVHVTPGFPARAMQKALGTELDALVLVLFGSATAPTHSPEFTSFLKEAKRKQVPVVCVTEGPAGRDFGDYEAGIMLKELGCVWAGRDTLEYAFVKTSFLIGSLGKKDRTLKRFSELYALPWGRLS